jgi:Mlc titration factor MtfA (ptsG expression regulator)
MNTRTFEGREGVEISNDMRLLISAIAVQITFGLRSYMMREFTKILVYPRAYFNEMAKRYHKGEVNPNGIVVLSWEDFYEGIRIPDDDLNLGLHEFAHVLALQRLNNRAFKDLYFAAAFDKLMGNLKSPLFRSAIQRRLKLRRYALTNPMEFFAVATEAFFENPIVMYQNNHIMYQLFEEMYNQNLIDLYQRPVQPLAK